MNFLTFALPILSPVLLRGGLSDGEAVWVLGWGHPTRTSMVSMSLATFKGVFTKPPILYDMVNQKRRV